MAITDITPATGRFPAGRQAFPHRDLTGIGHLARHEILYLLHEAEQWVALNRQRTKHTDLLAGLTIINAFFENSTRTLLSFEIAGKRLGADVVNMHAATSSVKKGETLIDTAITLNAMRADAIVIRHGSSGATGLIADKVDCPVLNAGDGQHEHPTQALLDALTLRHALAERGEGAEDFTGLRIVICGDILHSRVARSNILTLTALGAEVRVCAPPALMPEGIEALGVRAFHRFDAALEGAEVVMMLRLQSERMSGQFVPSAREYRHLYGLTKERLALAAPGALVMHPGPMNRGVEIDSEVADLAGRSLITRQVEMGVAIRMACLDVLTREARGVEGWAA
jgi:aspartate carbamoyltransferase catalytic subunit